MMWIKGINIIVLIGFLNTISYFPYHSSSHIAVQQKLLVQKANEVRPDFDGDTLLECILNDVLNIPINGDDLDTGLFYKYFNFLSSIHSISIKVLDSFISVIKPIATSLLSRESYFISKATPLIGYYIFLFRLKPF